MNEFQDVTPYQDLASLASEPPTLPDLFLRNAAEFDLPDALNYKKDGEWRHISSRTIVERAEIIALGLYSHGLRKGDRAAILAANSPASSEANEAKFAMSGTRILGDDISSKFFG